MQLSSINCFADIAPAGTRKTAVAIKKAAWRDVSKRTWLCCMNEDTEPL